MAIQAKFAGVCTRCGGPFKAGDWIVWTKGRGSEHSDTGLCAQFKADKPVPKVARPQSTRPALQSGEQYVSRPSRSRDDGYVVGTTYHMTRIPGGGGPDGLYWTVTAAGKFRDEDSQVSDWACWAHVRPATDAEAAPVAARLTEEATRKAEGEALTAALRQAKSEKAELPAGSREIWADHRTAGGEWWSLAPDGTLFYTRSDYDMGPTTWRTMATVEQVERAKALGLKPGLI